VPTAERWKHLTQWSGLCKEGERVQNGTKQNRLVIRALGHSGGWKSATDGLRDR